MSEFQREVEELARCIARERREVESGKLRTDALSEIVTDVVGWVNCYPGEPGFGCCEKAFFVSLSIKLAGSSCPHLKLSEAFGAMAKHCNGVCKRKTCTVILVADTWDAKLYEEWRPTIENFDGVYFEAYLMNGDKVTPIRI